jgi:hypothetical protein
VATAELVDSVERAELVELVVIVDPAVLAVPLAVEKVDTVAIAAPVGLVDLAVALFL